jgi:hypothetical protein
MYLGFYADFPHAHMALFSALAEALAKYHPERVMEHLRLFWCKFDPQSWMHSSYYPEHTNDISKPA